MSYPVDVDDSETIVRVLKIPSHFNKHGKLKPAAFKPPRGSVESSVIRWQYAPTNGRELKSLVVGIGSRGGAAYAGVAHLPARECRNSGVTIRDSRELFQGHADLIFPVATPGNDDPPEAPAHGVLFEITDKLAKAATTLLDPDPSSPDWTIPELPVPSP